MKIYKKLKKTILAALICVLAAALASCQNGTGQNTAQPENSANTVPVQNTETEEERLKREEEQRRKEIEANTNENNIVLTETKPADQQYLDETLFLGDSNTVRFAYMADENGSTFTSAKNTIAVSSMGVERISSLQCMQFSTGTFTMVKSVSIIQPRRIIITFGTNNLADSPSAFASKYERQLNAIVKAYPQADLIVNTIPPSASFCKYKFPKNEAILAFNEAIKAMCEKNSWKFLNTHEVLYDKETGYGISECFASDGLHLNRKGVEKVFEYILSHALYTEDRRPKPLKSIPKIYGALYNMLLEKDDEDDAADNTVDPTNTVPAGNTVPPEDKTPADNTVPPEDKTPADNTVPPEDKKPDDQTPTDNTVPPDDGQTPGDDKTAPHADNTVPPEDQNTDSQTPADNTVPPEDQKPDDQTPGTQQPDSDDPAPSADSTADTSTPAEP